MPERGVFRTFKRHARHGGISSGGDDGAKRFHSRCVIPNTSQPVVAKDASARSAKYRTLILDPCETTRRAARDDSLLITDDASASVRAAHRHGSSANFGEAGPRSTVRCFSTPDAYPAALILMNRKLARPAWPKA